MEIWLVPLSIIKIPPSSGAVHTFFPLTFFVDLPLVYSASLRARLEEVMQSIHSSPAPCFTIPPLESFSHSSNCPKTLCVWPVAVGSSTTAITSSEVYPSPPSVILTSVITPSTTVALATAGLSFLPKTATEIVPFLYPSPPCITVIELIPPFELFISVTANMASSACGDPVISSAYTFCTNCSTVKFAEFGEINGRSFISF